MHPNQETSKSHQLHALYILEERKKSETIFHRKVLMQEIQFWDKYFPGTVKIGIFLEKIMPRTIKFRNA